MLHCYLDPANESLRNEECKHFWDSKHAPIHNSLTFKDTYDSCLLFLTRLTRVPVGVNIINDWRRVIQLVRLSSLAKSLFYTSCCREFCVDMHQMVASTLSKLLVHQQDNNTGGD